MCLTVTSDGLGSTHTTPADLNIVATVESIASIRTELDTLNRSLPDTIWTSSPSSRASEILSENLDATESAARRHDGLTHITEEGIGASSTISVGRDGSGSERTSSGTRNVRGHRGIAVRDPDIEHGTRGTCEVRDINGDLLKETSDRGHLIF
jgi:hypothetical protein